MNRKTKSNKLLKVTATFLTLLFLFTTVLPIQAFASESITSPSWNGTGGYIKGSSSYASHFGGVGEDTDIVQFDLSKFGKTARYGMCIEPRTAVGNGDEYSESDAIKDMETADEYFNSLSDTQKQALGLVLHYGYYSGESKTNNLAYFDATQLLAWEILGSPSHSVKPLLVLKEVGDTYDYASFGKNHSSEANLIDNYAVKSNSGRNRQSTVDAYYDILSRIQNHDKLLTNSYDNKTEAKSSPIVLTWKNNRYEAKVTENTALWNDFNLSAQLKSAGFSVAESNASNGKTTYTIYTTKAFKGQKVIGTGNGILKQSTQSSSFDSLFIYENLSVPEEKGQHLAYGGRSDPVFAFIALEVETGDLTITKNIHQAQLDTTKSITTLKDFSTNRRDIRFYLKRGNEYIALEGGNGEYTYNGTRSSQQGIVLNTSGKINIEGLPYGEYTITEYCTTDFEDMGLKEPTKATTTFTISKASNTLTIVNEQVDIEGNITLTKYDKDYPENKLTGATFKVYTDTNKDGNYTEGTDKEYKTMTESNGVYTLKNVPYGYYLVHEEVAPEGFAKDDNYYSVFIKESKTYEVSNVDIGTGFYDDELKGDIKVQKATEGMLNLEGIKFILTGTSLVGNEVNLEATTDADGVALFEEIPVGVYTITEDGATVPTGYLVADAIEGVEVIYAEQTEVEVYNAEQTGSIKVGKTTEGQLNVDGIKFILTGTTTTGRDISIEATTDADGVALFEEIPVGVYTITEDGATVPTGYLVADAIEGVEVIYAEQTEVEVHNTEQTGSIKVGKTTEGMLNIEGIKFILSGTSTTGRDISIEAITDADGVALFEEIPVGVYTITEDGETTPVGYLTADAVEGVEVVYAEQTEIEVYNTEQTGSIKVGKTTEGMLNIEGIKFILSGTSTTGREISLEATTDAEGVALFEEIPVGVYTITEDGPTTPIGYLTADAVEGVEVVYAEQTEVEVHNYELTGSIKLTKTTSDNNPKAVDYIEFVLEGTSSTGRYIKRYATTDKDGVCVFSNIPEGVYTITEIESSVPYGYLVADKLQGVEVVHAEQTEVNVCNEKAEVPPDDAPPETSDTQTNPILALAFALVLMLAMFRRKQSKI